MPINDSGWWGGTDQRSLDLIQLARTPLSVYLCPSYPRDSREPANINGLAGQAVLTYLANAGGDARNDNLGTNGMDRSNGLFHAVSMNSGGVGRVFKFRDVTDGLSNTVLIGEAEHSASSNLGCGICDRSLFYHINADSGVGFDFSEALGSTYYSINQTSINTAAREAAFASYHAGGAHILFADGKVQFISESVDLVNVWRPLGSRNGQELIGQF